MQKRRIAIGAVILTGALTLAACGSDKKDPANTPSAGASATGDADSKPSAAPVNWPAPADAAERIFDVTLSPDGRHVAFTRERTRRDLLILATP